MPLRLPDKLPAIELLKHENIFVMDESRAHSQEIRPLKIVVLNLMPLKITTETDLVRLLSNTPLHAKKVLNRSAPPSPLEQYLNKTRPRPLKRLDPEVDAITSSFLLPKIQSLRLWDIHFVSLLDTKCLIPGIDVRKSAIYSPFTQ